jgi:acyl transferase domain-containing protein
MPAVTDASLRNMDPQQRQFLEATYEALEDAGQLPTPDGRNNIGLCVGAAHETWQSGKHSDSWRRYLNSR